MSHISTKKSTQAGQDTGYRLVHCSVTSESVTFLKYVSDGRNSDAMPRNRAFTGNPTIDSQRYKSSYRNYRVMEKRSLKRRLPESWIALGLFKDLRPSLQPLQIHFRAFAICMNDRVVFCNPNSLYLSKLRCLACSTWEIMKKDRNAPHEEYYSLSWFFKCTSNLCLRWKFKEGDCV